MKKYIIIGILVVSAFACKENRRQEIFMKQQDESAWVSFENLTGEKGASAQTNKGAKPSVALQQIGGDDYPVVLELWKQKVPLIPITVFIIEEARLIGLLDEPMQLDDPKFPAGWVNFYRQDDVSSVAYFYWDRP